MKRYIYMIEVQKSTGAHQFLKAFEEPLVVDKVEVNSKNKFAQKDFNDRIENYSYITEVEKDSWDRMLNYFYCLTRQYKESLEYTKDNYVYLITKEGQEPGIRIGHRLPHRLYKEDVRPIPFYPEKQPQEDAIDTNCVSCMTTEENLYSDEYFKFFFKKIRELFVYYCGKHTPEYIYFEAFVLTYGQLYKKIKEETYYFNHFDLNDFPVNLVKFSTDFIPTDQTYELYVKPTAEGEVFNLSHGIFYSAKTRESLIQTYREFFTAAQQWEINRLG